MQGGHVTTPFGRRTMTLALVKTQMDTAERRSGKAIDKWKVFRDICEARERLGLQDRAIAVLDALLSFYPETMLSDERGLVVFPSNAQLSLRAHGIADTTLRRHLAALVEAGLIVRRDSPNGKRYAHRATSGEIETAFGFDLTPLVARAGELATLAQAVSDERRHFKRLREALTLARRDVRKLVSAAMEEGVPGDWGAIEAHYLSLIARLPRSANRFQVEAILDEMVLLRDEILNILEMHLKTQDSTGNDSHDERHIQNSNTDTCNELEPALEKKQGEAAVTKPQPVEPVKTFPLGMILKACPQIADYTPDGTISKWRDIMSAAVVVRSTLGVSPSAYQEACDVMGPENAATAMACILERAGYINSAGGYLRDLTRKAVRGEFNLGPMLMALLHANAGGTRKSA